MIFLSFSITGFLSCPQGKGICMSRVVGAITTPALGGAFQETKNYRGCRKPAKKSKCPMPWGFPGGLHRGKAEVSNGLTHNIAYLCNIFRYWALPSAVAQTWIILFLVSLRSSPEREMRIKQPLVPESENCRANATATDRPKPRLAPDIRQQIFDPDLNIAQFSNKHRWNSNSLWKDPGDELRN